MPASECPNCHGELASAGKVRYCPQCGWRKKEAIAQLRMSIRMFPFAFAASLALTYFIFRNFTASRDFDLALAILLPLFAFALGFIFTRASLARVRSAPDFVERAATGAESSGERVAVETERQPIKIDEAAAGDRALFRTSRPREVRRNARGRRQLILAALLCVVFDGILLWSLYIRWALGRSFADFSAKEWAVAGAIVLTVLVFASFWRTLERQRDLLENGELALARVIKRWDVRRGATIFCEYQDSEDRWRKKSGFDVSGTLEEGMVTPVFYDPADPKRQIIYRTALFEVVTDN